MISLLMVLVKDQLLFKAVFLLKIRHKHNSTQLLSKTTKTNLVLVSLQVVWAYTMMMQFMRMKKRSSKRKRKMCR